MSDFDLRPIKPLDGSSSTQKGLHRIHRRRLSQHAAFSSRAKNQLAAYLEATRIPSAARFNTSASTNSPTKPSAQTCPSG